MSPEQGIDNDSLSGLEERIQKTVELVGRLRREKEAAQKEAADAQAKVAQLNEEVKTLHAERKQVRNRIERLLGQIDQLSAG